jgi:nucleotide-binding universal stress UspA family protein
MLKRILLLLGETKSSACARDYAFSLAEIKKARLVGLGGIDLAGVEAPMLGGIGTAALQAGIERQFQEEARESCQRLRNHFEYDCKERGLPFEWLSFQGDPNEPLCLASETCDLVVTGHDIAFSTNISSPLSEMLANLLQMTPRPVIVCPDERAASEDILVAYDGSIPAMRALQLFTLLGIGEGKRILVASIDPSKELAERRATGAANYLRLHGRAAEPHPLESLENAPDVLADEVVKRGIGTLVMGAYGHGGLRSFLFGSTTSVLAETPPCALFLYH